jgi:hypothetical protein
MAALADAAAWRPTVSALRACRLELDGGTRMSSLRHALGPVQLPPLSDVVSLVFCVSQAGVSASLRFRVLFVKN